MIALNFASLNNMALMGMLLVLVLTENFTIASDLEFCDFP
jgi:hypothetical protein